MAVGLALKDLLLPPWEGMTTGMFVGFYLDQLRTFTGCASFLVLEEGKNMTVTFAPWPDPQALDARIPFGTVDKIVADRRLVTCKIESAKIPEPFKPAVTDPDDPAFYEQNLADLKHYDAGRQRVAVASLRRTEPKELQAEIIQALQARLATTTDKVLDILPIAATLGLPKPWSVCCPTRPAALKNTCRASPLCDRSCRRAGRD